MPKRFRYSGKNLVGDYGRAITGIILSITPIIFVNLNLVVIVIFAALALLFLFFAARTLQRHATIIETTHVDITMHGPVKQHINWENVKTVNLSYFSTWHDRKKGWMQLKVTGNGGALKIDSNINGFDEIAAIVAQCVAHNSLSVNEVTIGNFEALGLTIGDALPHNAKLEDVDG